MIEQEADIVFNRMIARNTFLMALKSPEITSLARPGQFVMVRVSKSADPLLRRPFSICGTRGGDCFMILYRVVGVGTAILRNAGKGDRLSVLGPLGRPFDFSEKGKTSFLVAGGIGIAPLLFLAGVMDPGECMLLAGYGTSAEVVPVEQVGLSQENLLIATDDGTLGHKGVVTDLLEGQLGKWHRGRPVLFACGPLPMLKRVAAMSFERELECQVSVETAMACGIGACQGCAVRASSRETQPYLQVCRHGPVFSIRSLDWKAL